MFKYSALKLNRFAEMHKECQQCGFKFEPEPGFYYGAMFVSYAYSVAIIITVALALKVLIHPGVFDYILWATVLNLILVPFNFRFSRIAFLHFFGGAKYLPR